MFCDARTTRVTIDVYEFLRSLNSPAMFFRCCKRCNFPLPGAWIGHKKLSESPMKPTEGEPWTPVLKPGPNKDESWREFKPALALVCPEILMHCHRLLCALTAFHALSSTFNVFKCFIRVDKFSLVWPELVIVDESWRAALMKVNSHPRLARAKVQIDPWPARLFIWFIYVTSVLYTAILLESILYAARIGRVENAAACQSRVLATRRRELTLSSGSI